MLPIDSRFIRKPEVLKRLGISHATLHRHINNGTFVTPISLGARAVGFLEHEVDAIIIARMQQQDIVAVVQDLLKKRNGEG
ncbi:helix-turn-helix transcriptional regulator [Vibrio sinaloensis]|uniref:helix-turn-helix transcriptional regulator n=1 Tax=Photobacterium sp. (strain ATCC 43367) TaxID=379097 RepID=UPI00204C0F29|nr:AlpA family phage regulatory protein [Vibrio sinaloensis]UPQ87358.1 AlpA family phage regulatory protein [Vibrio sinaloensis]